MIGKQRPDRFGDSPDMALIELLVDGQAQDPVPKRSALGELFRIQTGMRVFAEDKRLHPPRPHLFDQALAPADPDGKKPGADAVGQHWVHGMPSRALMPDRRRRLTRGDDARSLLWQWGLV